MVSAKLSSKQKAFVRHYLADPSKNASKCYGAAYYTDLGKKIPSMHVCKPCAIRLMAPPAIQAELKHTLEVQTNGRRISTVDEALEHHSHALRFDPIALVDPDTGQFRALHEIPEEARLVLDGLDVHETIYEPSGGKGEVRRVARYRFIVSRINTRLRRP
jgi:hypothetical protein